MRETGLRFQIPLLRKGDADGASAMMLSHMIEAEQYMVARAKIERRTKGQEGRQTAYWRPLPEKNRELPFQARRLLYCITISRDATAGGSKDFRGHGPMGPRRLSLSCGKSDR